MKKLAYKIWDEIVKPTSKGDKLLFTGKKSLLKLSMLVFRAQSSDRVVQLMTTNFCSTKTGTEKIFVPKRLFTQAPKVEKQEANNK